MIPAPALCGKSFCALGCICDTLKHASSSSANPSNSTKQQLFVKEHCSRWECMLHCTCGFLPNGGRPSGCKSFSSLLKGNEAFYSKINWSSKRQRRERKMPQRFRDSVFLDNVTSSTTLKSGSSTPTGSSGSSSSSASSRSPRSSRDQAKEAGRPDKIEPFRMKFFADKVYFLFFLVGVALQNYPSTIEFLNLNRSSLY